MDIEQVLVTFSVAALGGVGGVLLGAFLERRNEARAEATHLLTQAPNDAVAAIAEIALKEEGVMPRPVMPQRFRE